jgi:hypothetical protein
MEQPPAGWYPDPLGGHPLRYWDGQHWTDHVSDGGPTTGFVAAPTAPPVAGVASKNRNVRWLISGGHGGLHRHRVEAGHRGRWRDHARAGCGRRASGVEISARNGTQRVHHWRRARSVDRGNRRLHMVDVKTQFADSDLAVASIGMGLWITLLGAIALGAGCIYALARRNSSSNRLPQ